MKTLETNCPDCNSLQKFSPQEEVENGFIREYIKCYMCGTVTTLDIYPREQKVNRRKMITLRNRRIRSNLRRR